jgi:hypothetical protein
MSEDRMITSESIAGIALKAARLLASGKIDPATATRIGAGHSAGSRRPQRRKDGGRQIRHRIDRGREGVDASGPGVRLRKATDGL